MIKQGRLRLENFPRSVSSSIFCMNLLSAFNNARFKFQGSGSNTLEDMSICLNHIKGKNFRRIFENIADSEFQQSKFFQKNLDNFCVGHISKESLKILLEFF